MKPDPCFTMFHDFAIRFCQGASVDTLKSHYNDLVSFVRNLSPEARHGRSPRPDISGRLVSQEKQEIQRDNQETICCTALCGGAMDKLRREIFDMWMYT